MLWLYAAAKDMLTTLETREMMSTLRRTEAMLSVNTDWKMRQRARPEKSGIWESSYRNLGKVREKKTKKVEWK